MYKLTALSLLLVSAMVAYSQAAVLSLNVGGKPVVHAEVSAKAPAVAHAAPAPGAKAPEDSAEAEEEPLNPKCTIELIKLAESCDKEWNHVDNKYDALYAKLDAVCGKSDSEDCEKKYAVLDKAALNRYKKFHARCKPVYLNYRSVCASEEEKKEEDKEKAKDSKDDM